MTTEEWEYVAGFRAACEAISAAGMHGTPALLADLDAAALRVRREGVQWLRDENTQQQARAATT